MRAADPSSGHVIVLDEVHCYCSPKQSPDELLEVMRVGRHSRVDVVFASQRIVGVHRDLTAQADELRFFHNTEPLDLKRIAEHCGTEFADGLRKLKQHSSSTWTG